MATGDFAAVAAHIDSQRDAYREEFFTLLRQPSISTQGVGVIDCAKLLAGMMEASGIATQILDTAPDGWPVVYGEVAGPPGSPTLVFYGHYDVQPPEPFEAWHSPPFEPTIRNNRVYARGTGDNKGQLLAHVFATRSLMAARGQVPCTLKFIFEGEEEMSSVHLPSFLKRERDRLRGDLLFTADGPMDVTGRPIVNFGCRGMLYLEIEANGANRDAHSGHYGGLFPNPAWELVQLLATIRGADGRCLIPGFYDRVRPMTEQEKAYLADIPFDRAAFLRDNALHHLDPAAERGVTAFDGVMTLPTCNLAGLTSGYGGKGSKTVLPSTAVAKIDMRLVKDQDPEELWPLVQAHVAQHAPHITVRKLGAMRPAKTPVELPVSQAVIRAVEQTYSQRPIVIPLTGATGPYAMFEDALGIPKAGVPYANYDEHNHAPNENMDLDLFHLGIKCSLRVIEEVAKTGR